MPHNTLQGNCLLISQYRCLNSPSAQRCWGCFYSSILSIQSKKRMAGRWYPQIIHFNRSFHYKPSILGYPYFRKHPFPGGGRRWHWGEVSPKTFPMNEKTPRPWPNRRRVPSKPPTFGCDGIFVGSAGAPKTIGD